MAANVRKIKDEISEAFKTFWNNDLKKSNLHLTEFHTDWSRVRWQLVHFKIDPIATQNLEPSVIDSYHTNNCNTASAHPEWSAKGERSQEFGYSFTEGLELGAEIEVGENLLIEEASAKFSAKVNFSATQEKKVKTVESVTKGFKFDVDPCTAVNATVKLRKREFKNISFQARVKAAGFLIFQGKDNRGQDAFPGYPTDVNIDSQLKLVGMKNEFDAKGKLSGTLEVGDLDIDIHAVKPKCNPDDLCSKQPVAPGAVKLLT